MTSSKATVPPRVSVLIPIYNAQRFINETITSILGQTFTDFELLALNDGSTDATAEILQEYREQDPRVILIDKPNEGLIKTLNTGIERATAPLIARLDHDDLARPTRLEKQVAFLDDNPDYIGCGCLIQNIGPDGSKIGNSNTKPRTLVHDPTAFPPVQMWLYGPTPMIRSKALKQAGGYRDQFLAAEDRDLCWRLGAIGKLHMIPELLVEHRLHDANLSLSKRNTQLHSAFFSDLSAICAHIGRSDAHILEHIHPGGPYDEIKTAYCTLLNDAYDVETYWLLFLAKYKAWDIGGYTSRGQFAGAVLRHIAARPLDPSRLKLLKKSTPHLVRSFTQPLGYTSHP